MKRSVLAFVIAASSLAVGMSQAAAQAPGAHPTAALGTLTG